MKPSHWMYRCDRVTQALRRRRLRGAVERTYEELVAGLDQKAFRTRLQPHWDPFETTAAAKFLDVQTWLRETIFRYLLIGEQTGAAQPQSVLDLGAGTGYFLLVCRHRGASVMGLDLDDEPLYRACFEFFDLPRVVHRIEPQQPLPRSAGPYDLITALMTCFNQDDQGRPWGVAPWRFFLDDVRDQLLPGGQFVIKFNLESSSGRFYSPEIASLLHHAPGYKTRVFLDYVLLRRRD